MSHADGGCSIDTPELDRLLSTLARNLSKAKAHSHRMVNYRRQKKSEFAELREEVEQLECAKRDLIKARQTASRAAKRSLLLPWKEVETALLDAKQEVESEQHLLEWRLRSQARAIKDLYTWAQCHASLRQSVASTKSTWRNVTLFSNPVSRKLGKDWITKQMYHNTARTFDLYNYPHNAGTPFATADVDFTEDGFVCVHQGMFVVGCPVPVLLNVLQNHTCDWSLVDGGHPVHEDTQAEVAGSTTLHQLVTPRHKQHMNLLTGNFVDGDGGFVFVAQQILDDELFVPSTYQRRRMFWIDGRRRSNGAVVVKYITFEFQGVLADGELLGMKEEAECRQFSAQAAWSEAQFQAAFRSHSKAMSDRCLDRFRCLVLSKVAAVGA